MSRTPRLQGNDGFSVRQARWGNVIECAPLAAVAAHCFTTRDVDFRSGRPGADSAWRALAGHLGVAADRVHRPRQVHGVTVAVAPTDGGDRRAWRSPPEADVIVCGERDAAVAVQTADCVAILIADRRRSAVAAVHAGWRGTAARAASIAVAALAERYGSAASDLVVAVGPSIGPCCYEVGDDVRAAFVRAGHEPPQLERWFATAGAGRWHLDLWTANRDQLVSAGVPGHDVHVAQACTATELTRFFSYRKEGASTGRMVAAICGRP